MSQSRLPRIERGNLSMAKGSVRKKGKKWYARFYIEVQALLDKGQKVPHLAAVLVGTNGASLTYVGSKVKTCQKIGFQSSLIELPETITEAELLVKIDELNNNDEIDGFIVQLPLPKHINEQKILMAIDPDKDVDGFHPTNFGRMALELEAFIPATPFGILQLLDRNKIDTKGKHVVVIGRSNIVGRKYKKIFLCHKGFVLFFLHKLMGISPQR